MQLKAQPQKIARNPLAGLLRVPRALFGISGALFAPESVLGSMAMESFVPLVISSLISNATLHRLMHVTSVFVVPRVSVASHWELLFYILLGVLLGHRAPPFLGLLDVAKAKLVKLKLPLYVQLALGGAGAGIISVFLPQVWGNGYRVVSRMRLGEVFDGTLCCGSCSPRCSRPHPRSAPAACSRPRCSSARRSERSSAAGCSG